MGFDSDKSTLEVYLKTKKTKEYQSRTKLIS